MVPSFDGSSERATGRNERRPLSALFAEPDVAAGRAHGGGSPWALPLSFLVPPLNRNCVLRASLASIPGSAENAVHVRRRRDPIYLGRLRRRDGRSGLGEKGGGSAVNEKNDRSRPSIKDVTLAAGLIITLASMAAVISPKYLEVLTNLLASCAYLAVILKESRP